MGAVPRDVEDVFDVTDQDKVWDYLHDTFHMNSKAWKQEFRNVVRVLPRNVSENEAFLQFGNKKIQPLLNALLKRDEFHPTWINLVRFVVKDKIESKKQYKRR